MVQIYRDSPVGTVERWDAMDTDSNGRVSRAEFEVGATVDLDEHKRKKAQEKQERKAKASGAWLTLHLAAFAVVAFAAAAAAAAAVQLRAFTGCPASVSSSCIGPHGPPRVTPHSGNCCVRTHAISSVRLPLLLLFQHDSSRGGATYRQPVRKREASFLQRDTAAVPHDSGRCGRNGAAPS